MIKDNLSKLREQISSVCAKINRDPESVVIIAVSKNRSVEQIRVALQSGITDIGENKVQEALLKYNQLSAISYQL